MENKDLYQVYCNSEYNVNIFLSDNYDVIEVMDIKLSVSNEKQIIMVVYKQKGELK